jgi:hypothetical protein
MRRADWIAVLLSLLAAAAAGLVAGRIYEGIPHLEDELAYVWQAQVMAAGKISLPSPAYPDSFMVPFVVDAGGQRFGKYPPGWPAALSLGARLDLQAWVNPLLAGLGVWLTYLLGKKLFHEGVGLLAGLLTLTSPLVLVNAGALLSHPWGLALSAGFAGLWLAAFVPPPGGFVRRPWIPAGLAGLLMGMLFLSRPYTAVGVALPFGLHGLYLLWRGGRPARLGLLAFAAASLPLAGLLFVWQSALTGDPFLNPYTLWWPYDRIGFGPGIGVLPQGHSLHQGWINSRFSLQVGAADLFGWGRSSWVFLPFGVWAMRRNRPAWLAAGVFPSLFGLYLAYWVGAWLFGPRYYYEGLFSLTLVSAAGIAWLAGWPLQPGQAVRPRLGWRRLRPLLVTFTLGLLISLNLVFYLPGRLGMMYGLYGISRARLAPFQTAEAQALAPALVLVDTPRWMPYGALLSLQDPFLTTPFIFAMSIGPQTDAQVAALFPERQAFYYYPDDPYRFYTAPRSP